MRFLKFRRRRPLPRNPVMCPRCHYNPSDVDAGLKVDWCPDGWHIGKTLR